MFQDLTRREQKNEFRSVAANVKPDGAKVVTPSALAGNLERKSNLTGIHAIAERAGSEIEKRGAELGADRSTIVRAVEHAKYAAVAKGGSEAKAKDSKASAKGENGGLENDGLKQPKGLATAAMWGDEMAQSIPIAPHLKQGVTTATRQGQRNGAANAASDGLDNPELVAQSTGNTFPRISKPGTYIPRPQNPNSAFEVEELARQIGGKAPTPRPNLSISIPPELSHDISQFSLFSSRPAEALGLNYHPRLKGPEVKPKNQEYQLQLRKAAA